MKKTYNNKCDLLINKINDDSEFGFIQYSPELPSEAELYKQMIQEFTSFSLLAKLSKVQDLKDFDNNSEISYVSVESEDKFSSTFVGDYFNCNGKKIVKIEENPENAVETDTYVGKNHNNENIKLVETSIANKPSYGQLEFSSFKDAQGVCQSSLKLSGNIAPSFDQQVTFVNNIIVNTEEDESSEFIVNYQTDKGAEFKLLKHGATITKADVATLISQGYNHELAEYSQCLGEDALMTEAANII